MKLDTFLKSKVRWHLGYNLTSVPAGDQGRLEEALDNIQAFRPLISSTTSWYFS